MKKRTPKKKQTKPVAPLPRSSGEDHLFSRVVGIIEGARAHVARSVNTAIVQAYWLIGREIVEVEQAGEKRAGYGERIIEGLAKRLLAQFPKGFSVPNLRNMRQFYAAYPQGSALPVSAGAATIRSTVPSASSIRSAAPSESGSVPAEGAPPLSVM